MEIKIKGMVSNHKGHVELRTTLISHDFEEYVIQKIYPKELLAIGNIDMRERLFDEMTSNLKEAFMRNDFN